MLKVNLFDTIAAAALDPAVGIRVARLTGDESFSLFGAEIGPHRRVGAHYHDNGIETYQIVEGRGAIHLGRPAPDGKVTWEESTPVKAGDCFTVQPGQVHQLENTSDTRMVAVFGCPANHLGDDRTMVAGREET